MVGDEINTVPLFATATVGTANEAYRVKVSLSSIRIYLFSYEWYANLLPSHALRYNEVFIEWLALEKL